MFDLMNDPLVWVDNRVFWVDKAFFTPHRGRVIQTDSRTAPQREWENCIELSFDGADWKDTYAIADQLFDNHPHHDFVFMTSIHAIKALNKIQEESKL